MKGLGRRALLAAAIGGAVMLFAAIAGASPISNGGFENGNLDGWTTDSIGPADWFASEKIITPVSGKGYFGPADKNWTSVSDQEDAAATVMYRFINVGKNSKIQALVYYKNRTSTFCSPADLNPLGAFCNQQYRIDILDQGADPFSMDPGDILKNLFHTSSGSPKAMNPKNMTFKLGSISGTVMLRFAVASNVNIFNASVDNVQINNG